MELYAELMSEYLKTAPDQAWLYSAGDSNYDGNGQLIHWMIDQPNCPQAAALAIFWYSGAGYYGQFQSRDDVPSHGKDTYDFLHDSRPLAGRVLQGDGDWLRSPQRPDAHRQSQQARSGLDDPSTRAASTSRRP